VKKLLIVACILASTASANETSVRSLQSGWFGTATPVFDHGIHGEGQVIAILDTAVDWTSCYFAEQDNSKPPFNTGSPSAGFFWQNVDTSRRKIIAYDLLYSCDQYPNARDCETPAMLPLYDNNLRDHGTHAAGASVGDKGTPIFHDYADAIAPGAKLVVQDAGLSAFDACTARPGIGCPVAITPALDQAYKQGARIHSNSWGDYQSVTGTYSHATRDLDAFVYAHPDMLVVFNTGNAGSTPPPASSISTPGDAKNSLQVGGTRGPNGEADNVVSGGLIGPTRDGRIKPDIVGPAYVVAGDFNGFGGGNDCVTTGQPGTSWASPTIAGAAALVRQYYTDGFYPTGVATASNRFTPSAALLKASMIAAARAVPLRNYGVGAGSDTQALPVPSPEQGWGFPVLDDVLYFPGDTSKLRVVDSSPGLATGESATIQIAVKPGTPLKALLVWTDPPGVTRAASDKTPELVNDLDLVITTPDGTRVYGNDALHPGQADRLNNVEVAPIDVSTPGVYKVEVNAHAITSGARQSYALVITGDFAAASTPQPRLRAVRH
jgi:hypothetical protein